MRDHAPGLSAVMIGRDSAGTLRESLGALAPVVDEIVFVDTGSRDATMTIAREFGCRVVEFAWCNDFSGARNFGIAQATRCWILSVDTDEVVRTAHARAVLDQAMATESPAYLVYQDNLYDSGERRPNPVARLFRNDERIAYRNPVHECVSQSVLEHWPAHPWSVLDIHLEHRGFLSGNIVGKHERNAAILHHWVASVPDDPFANFKLGSTLWDLGRCDEAMRSLDHTYELLADPTIRLHAAYLRVFIAIYIRALHAQRGAQAADAFARDVDANGWLAHTVAT